MEFLNLGILGCCFILALDLGVKLLGYFPSNLNILKKTWHKLELDEYKIKKYNNTGLQETFIVIIPLGKSYDDFVKLKNIIEKAYRCKCEISDEEYSNYVNVTLTYKSI